ncbi:hypothetical protein BDZ88DRAFT_411832 [Geranomyces variabilis]|nr:hypothetical protein BDZ88DRAFT_411832 [Geranomyces variabilis]
MQFGGSNAPQFPKKLFKPARFARPPRLIFTLSHLHFPTATTDSDSDTYSLAFPLLPTTPCSPPSSPHRPPFPSLLYCSYACCAFAIHLRHHRHPSTSPVGHPPSPSFKVTRRHPPSPSSPIFRLHPSASFDFTRRPPSTSPVAIEFTRRHRRHPSSSPKSSFFSFSSVFTGSFGRDERQRTRNKNPLTFPRPLKFSSPSQVSLPFI